MNRPAHHQTTEPEEVSLTPQEGWHCTHSFYRFDRGALARMTTAERAAGIQQLVALLSPGAADLPTRCQVSVVSGHKADFALMTLDPSPLVVDSIHQRLLASPLGPALVPTYSFVSLTEVSEYVPTIEQYSDKLVEEGEERGSPSFEAKVKAYTAREEMMRKQRLTPTFPDWPSTCFYPMNKIRDPHANWFSLPFPERNRLMSEHGKTGMKFAGKVQQLVTVGIGLEDWEWGVTLWARNPQFLQKIVYQMRFDLASAKYAEFGPFYTSYVVSPAEMVRHCQLNP